MRSRCGFASFPSSAPPASLTFAGWTCRTSSTACSPPGWGRRRSRPPCTRCARSSAARSSGATWPRTRARAWTCPAARGRRTRFATPAEAEALIAAAPEGDRAIWATAFYAGLRHGELRALRVEDVDLATGVIRVERGWDRDEGAIDLKSNAGRRKVPVVGALRDYLLDHLARTERRGADLIFGNTPESPFAANRLQRRADEAWEVGGLARITPHECRHSFAAMMIAAGVNAKALQTFMGHASITVTLDTYGHLMPGSEAEAAGLVESYLDAQRERAEDAARAAGDVLTGASTGARE